MRKSACKTDKGKVRKSNEDAVLCMDSLGFYMVADGVGGHNSGELASSLAVDLMKEFLLSHPPERVEEDSLDDFFAGGLQWINEEIYRKASSEEKNEGMATTAVLLLLRGQKAFIANIGDSRVYLFREGQLRRITEDHTYVNELLKKGCISKTEAEVHPKRNMITRALGSEEKIVPDFYRFDVTIGDRILLCTDGLYNEVDEEDIRGLIHEEADQEKLISALIERACDNGGRDNISVICVEI